jgi:DNA-binding response OmpR family regulator
VPALDGAVTKALEIVGAVGIAASGANDLIATAIAEPVIGGAIVDVTAVPLAEAMACCKSLRGRDPAVAPIVLVLADYHLDDLDMREEFFDDFVVAPVDARELAARLHHRLVRAGHARPSIIVEQDGLTINLETYQAAIAGRPLDLTYMEYELLRFLAMNPRRVLTRQMLLSRVWGYEYYGGARTVDVHVRRLRAKLGEEHAALIQTVRSVGYRFGDPGDSLDAEPRGGTAPFEG